MLRSFRACSDTALQISALRKAKQTQSVADQEKIKALFPNTYGKKEITFQKGAEHFCCEEAGCRRYPFRRTGSWRTQRYLRSVRCVKGNQPGERTVRLQGRSERTDRRQLSSYLMTSISMQYRNTGGFDIIGSGRTKLETQEQFADRC